MTNRFSKKARLFDHFTWKPFRFVQLLIFLILVMLLSPFLNRTPLFTALLTAFFLNILLVSLSILGVNVRSRLALIGLWLLVPLFDWAALLTRNLEVGIGLTVASNSVRVLLLIICVVLILRYVLSSHEVTLDTIFGAFVAYFLIAFAFSSIFLTCVVLDSASFSVAGFGGAGDIDSLKVQLNYFSFVTIATLGYGDIVPKLPITQMLAILEAVIGQFYMAVVIAWLVSTYARRR
ncbi:MAG: potassium channel protein [Deltaproteobacteria bacterium]|nr:potassium channel protein [Deltaproteobacteria bacterium]